MSARRNPPFSTDSSPRRKRNLLTREAAVISAFIALNVPLVAAWWWLTAPRAPRGLNVPALFMLLLIALLTMVVLPLCIDTVRRKRWLLIALLTCTNLYWCLEWISRFAMTRPHDADYRMVRIAIPIIMLASSFMIALIYAGIDALLSRTTQE